MTNTVNGKMITLAREEQGMSQAAFAKKVGIAQTRLSRYEVGLSEVSEDHLQKIADCVERPTSFFFWRERICNSSCMYHRKRKSIAVRDLKRIHARVNILRIQTTRLLERAQVKSDYSFHRLDMSRVGGPEKAAQTMRYLWQLPTGPIDSVVDVIERAGGIVFRMPFGSAKVDGISQWPLDAPELPPVFFISEDIPADRMRWTLAHEIGHITLHHLPSDDPEAEADRFACEFLMPAEEIKDELFDISLPSAADLKAVWKVSMQSLIRRARHLGQINQDRYEYLFKLMSMRGYRTCEPVPLPHEVPQMLPEILDVIRSQNGMDVEGLSTLLGMREKDFRSQYWKNLSGLRLVG